MPGRGKESKYVANFPHLLAEWHHYKNTNLRPTDVPSNSTKPIWWKCDKGDDHEWKASPRNRTIAGSNCPYCAGQRATSDNNLALARPELVPIWDYEVNDKKPTELMKHSNYVAQFKCQNDPSHTWKRHILRKKSDCPICAFERDALFTMAPHLKGEWDFEANKDLPLNPFELTGRSTKDAYWVCSNDRAHRWRTQIRNRAILKSGCPYCGGQLAWSGSNLAVDAPDIAAEWHPSKNRGIGPSTVKARSGVKRWWLCPKGHSYQASPDARTGKGTGCPKCSPSTSSPEIRIFSELSALFPEARQREKVFGVELDVWIPTVDVGVEYDGSHWHKKKGDADLRKNLRLEEKGVVLLRMRASPLPKIRPYDIICQGEDVSKAEIHSLLLALRSLGKASDAQCKQYEDQKGFLNDDEYRRILSYLPSPTPENSLSRFVPEAETYWDYEANSPLVPSNFTPHSNKTVSWRCSASEDHKWKARINDFEKTRKCPFCDRTRPSSTYNLETSHPDIAAEWHPTKNSLSPSELTPSSNLKAWWRCQSDPTHEWATRVGNRTTLGNGCPICSGRKASPKTSFAAVHPHLLNSWDFSKNSISPHEVRPKSNKIVHWVCPDYPHHQWQQQIYIRLKFGCPYCVGRKTHKLDAVASVAPELLKEFVRFSSAEDRNKTLNDVSPGSGYLVRWRCSVCGDEYSQPIKSRIKKSGCKKCNGTKGSKSLGARRPDLALQWHPSRNGLELKEIFNLNEPIMAWWVCKQGHEWQESLKARWRGKKSCPICEENKLKNSLRAEALKYSSRWEFQKADRNTYMRIQRRGWLEECCSHMDTLKKPNGYWTFETCQQESKRYSGRTAFKNGNKTAYNLSLKKGWLNTFFPKA